MLKQLMLRKKLEQRKAALAELLTQEETLKTRSAEIEKAIDEAKTDEEMAVVEENAVKLEGEKTELAGKKSKLEGEIAALETEIAELSAKDPETAPASKSEDRGKSFGGGETRMRNRGVLWEMKHEERSAFLAREDVKELLTRVRTFKGQTRAVSGTELTIPEVMLDLLRDNLHRYSKLITKVRVKTVGGKARQNIMGAVPEGVWMETVGALNELDFVINQMEVDGFKVGGFVPIANPTLEDSDLNLANEILDVLGQAIGQALDKAILYGTDVKMPLGIATRLAQASAPSDWNANAPAWTDLRTSNIQKLNLGAVTAEAFFATLLLSLGIADPKYATGGTFWAMNRKTRMSLLAKAIKFNAAGALVAGVNSTMPIEGGDIVELPFIPDNDLIGGYGSLYLLAERAGASLAASEHVRFLQDQTVFRGTARYDGAPVFGEGFVIVNIANTDVTTSKTFATDWANTEIGALAVTSAASGTTSGKTAITVAGKEVSGTTLAYKIAGKAINIANGSKPVGFTAWNGLTEIEAATGTIITVVELNGDGRAIKVGSCNVVSKA